MKKAPKMKENRTHLIIEKDHPPSVKHEGKEIVLPADPTEMPEVKAAEYLLRLAKEKEEVVTFAETFEAQPLEGAHALMKAMRDQFGWPNAVPTPGFFGAKPPLTLSLQVGLNQYAEVIWGTFELPNLEETKVQCQATLDPKHGYCFVMSATCKKKHQPILRALAKRVKDFIKNENIYKGQALSFDMQTQGNMFDGEVEVPVVGYLDLSSVNPEELVFSAETQRTINANLFTPIEYTKQCREAGIPLKRGILLEGRYGVGKTLTAHVTAGKCVANKWTFILIPKSALLEDAVRFASKYQPCVIFCEDIDRTASGERTEDMDSLLNTIDGIGSKGKELMVVLTTNHVELINPAMLRPGRLDAVVSITAPDEEACRRLVRLYGRGLVDTNEPLKLTGEVLKGMIPAVVREAVERAKLYVIANSQGRVTNKLCDKDIADSAESLKSQVALLERPKSNGHNAMHQVGEALVVAVSEAVHRVVMQGQEVPRTQEMEALIQRANNGA